VRHNRSILAADSLTSNSERMLGVVDALAVVMGDVTQLGLGAGSSVEPFSVLDVRDGPIVMGKNVTISAHSTIQGPCYIGDNTVVDAGVIRGGTSIGPVCRLSGEIEESVFQGFSNKHHLGFMGHAWVGEWVNLGAGTNNSDLKNNYGRVRAGSPAGSVDTGMQKLGCFIGDHTKTGIGSLLNTGAVIGPFCNLLGGKVSPKYLPPFSWEGVDGFEKYRVDEAIRTAKTVMRRRSVQMSPHYERAIVDLYEARDTGVD
jgi:UDP-N-acetylglucosamine diphosphorylase/glucosamine-1-phosphate N-acetyltransferase